MERFDAQALTHMLVVADAAASRDWYVDVLDASVYHRSIAVARSEPSSETRTGTCARSPS